VASVVRHWVQRRWLEEELARRYRDAAPATLALLQERCEGVAAELVAAESRLQAAEDVTSLRRAGDWLQALMQIRHSSLVANDLHFAANGLAHHASAMHITANLT